MITLTSKLLHDASTKGYHGFTRAQMDVLGVSWPPKQGWLKRLIGKTVSEDTYARFKAAATVDSKAFRRMAEEKQAGPVKVAPKVIRSMEFTDDAGNEMVHIQINLSAKDAVKLMEFLRTL